MTDLKCLECKELSCPTRIALSDSLNKDKSKVKVRINFNMLVFTDDIEKVMSDSKLFIVEKLGEEIATSAEEIETVFDNANYPVYHLGTELQLGEINNDEAMKAMTEYLSNVKKCIG
jgi:hypothetical protein